MLSGKAHTSALCILAPYNTWRQVQRIRCFKDKTFVRWPPHINLLYPFVQDSGGAFQDAAQRATKALADLPPFALHLDRLQHFEHGRSCTLWSGPSAPEAQAALRQLQPTWEPIELPVWEVALISREGCDDPFTVRWTVPLGVATSHAPYMQPQEWNVPYVATMGRQPEGGGALGQLHNAAEAAPAADAPSTALKHGAAEGAALQPWLDASRFGVGALAHGQPYNFAFGANMNGNKLRARGIDPLDSKPAQLQGWRLLFDHRGGFGNIEPAAHAAAAAAASAATAPGVQPREQQQHPPGGASGGAPGAAPAAAAAHAPSSVHGVLHRLTPADLAKLANAEHEYMPLEVLAQPYDGSPPVPAVAFVTPRERRTRPGLPTTKRYHQLLVEGAKHWALDEQYVRWLERYPTIASEARGDEHYTSPQGERLAGWQKIRTGSGGAQRRGGGGGRGGGVGGRGGGKSGGRGRGGRQQGSGSSAGAG